MSTDKPAGYTPRLQVRHRVRHDGYKHINQLDVVVRYSGDYSHISELDIIVTDISAGYT